ncbi:DUF6114 domain-containing protein [Actinoplanes sp. NPDC051861]|uniref:DUF6114 domain-containing protein n=1 Tax=Actinoplanes sp. NPDC051861 TaxID=3155170 RepID=UPI003414ED9B
MPAEWRRRWRRWRRSRPFWGGLFVLLGGIEIFVTVWAPLPVVLKVGMQSFLGYLIPLVIILCGLLLWFNPSQRVFYSLVAILLCLSSWITSNMGGFVVGLLLGLVGGSLAFAWTPSADEARAPVVDDARAPVVDDARAPVADEARALVVDDARALVVDDARTLVVDVGEGRAPVEDESASTRPSAADDLRGR